MKTHKAYLINSEARRIDEVEVGDYKDIQNKIGCRIFTVAAYLDDNDALYVDDEGYLNSDVKKGFFTANSFLLETVCSLEQTKKANQQTLRLQTCS